MEYLGAGLGAGADGLRVPVCEHAYDLETATLAGHPAGSGPGWGFPSCQCGWNSQPKPSAAPTATPRSSAYRHRHSRHHRSAPPARPGTIMTGKYSVGGVPAPPLPPEEEVAGNASLTRSLL
jgi:hypothetical protein